MNRISLRSFAFAVMAVLLSSSLALAQPGAHDHGGQAGAQAQAQALTPEQQAKLDKILADYQKKTFPLSQDMWAKHTELQALSANPNTKPEQISKLVAELKDLRAKQFAAREALNETLKKEGLPAFGAGGCGMMGRGMGHGMKGGPAMMGGRGMMKGNVPGRI